MGWGPRRHLVAPAPLSKFPKKRAEMPHVVYAHKVNRVTFSGTMFGGAEEWSTGLWMGEEGQDAQVPTQASADAFLALWTTFFESSEAQISYNYLTTQVKVAHINTNGTTDQANVQYAFPGAVVDGQALASVFPPQCSLVVTLMSDRPRGLASKGRMYIPGVCWGVGTNGKLTTANRDSFAGKIEAFFNGIRAHADIADDPILAAKGTGAFPELTAQNDYIEKLKVGDVYDTQRRRRNGLTESYITKTLV